MQKKIQQQLRLRQSQQKHLYMRDVRDVRKKIQL